MNVIKTTVATLALLTATSVAIAGPYIGIEANSTAASTVSYDDTFKNFDDRSTGYGLTAGWKFGALAVEGQYLNGDDFSDGTKTVDSEGWTISGLGYVPVSKTFSLYGEVGYYDFSTDVDFGIEPFDATAASALDGESGVLFGAGVNWEFWKNLSARAGATLYDSEVGSLNSLQLGLNWEFK